MAMNDWNGDGKNDETDAFLEYMIYNDVTGGNNFSYNRYGKKQTIIEKKTR